LPASVLMSEPGDAAMAAGSAIVIKAIAARAAPIDARMRMGALLLRARIPSRVRVSDAFSRRGGQSAGAETGGFRGGERA